MGSLQLMWKRVRDRHQDDRGASLVEYALLVALIAVVCIAAIGFLGHSASSKYSHFGTCWAKAGDVNANMTDCH